MSECIVRFQKRWVDEIKRIGCAGCPIKFQSCLLKEHDKEPCPILCVLPESHGRLVDADAMDKRVYNDIPISVFGSVKKMAAVRQIIEDAPTIVPAAKEGE